MKAPFSFLSNQASPSTGASRGTIFISGYWPPTNIERPDGMLRQFRSMTKGQLGEYIIDNYEGSHYRIVTLATEFPGQTGAVCERVGPFAPCDTRAQVWGGGMGFWQVDYPLTSYAFWNLMVKYRPIALMTTSRASPDKIWTLEIGATNLPQNSWAILPWNLGRPPYIGGSDIDPAAAPGLPNAHGFPRIGDPPDTTHVQNYQLNATDAVKALQVGIVNVLNARFPRADLTAEQKRVVQGPPPDNYVSSFAGYHAVWYNTWSPACKAGWHTHVGFGMTTATAARAIRLQLLALIDWLNARL